MGERREGQTKMLVEGGSMNKHMNAIKKRDQRKAYAEKQASGVERAGAAAASHQRADSRIRKMRKDMEKKQNVSAVESTMGSAGSSNGNGLLAWFGFSSKRVAKTSSSNSKGDDASRMDDMMMLGFESKSAHSRLETMKSSVQKSAQQSGPKGTKGSTHRSVQAPFDARATEGSGWQIKIFI